MQLSPDGEWLATISAPVPETGEQEVGVGRGVCSLRSCCMLPHSQRPGLHKCCPLLLLNMPRQGKAANMPRQGKAANMPRQGKAANMPRQGKAANVPRQGKAAKVPRQGKAAKVQTLHCKAQGCVLWGGRSMGAVKAGALDSSAS